jgi:serine/threonine protein kinase
VPARLPLSPHCCTPRCLPASLSSLRRSGRQVAADVAEALAYLHTQHQIMHSDVKARWGCPPVSSAPLLPCVFLCMAVGLQSLAPVLLLSPYTHT